MNINGSTDWITSIALRSSASPEAIHSILIDKGIHPAPVAGSPRRLLIKRIAFSGVKTGVRNAGPFEFEWSDLSCGLWAAMTDNNLRGKSTVLHMILWLLRGRPPMKFQDDVKGWLSHASLSFTLDQDEYEVSIETTPQASGRLVRRGSPSDHSMAHFHDDNEFEAVMADFFLRELSLGIVTNWVTAPNGEGGRAVVHGWPALSGALFIGTDYSSLLGDIPPSTGLPLRLLQMYLGLPWISTLTAAKAAQSGAKRELDALEIRKRAGQAARDARMAMIGRELNEKRSELAGMPKDSDIRAKLDQLGSTYIQLKSDEFVLLERLSRIELSISQAEVSYASDRQELAAHIDAVAAGAVFRMLDPSCCPRCETRIQEDRKKSEKLTQACSVCGESISEGIAENATLCGLEAAVGASRSALKSARSLKLSCEEQLKNVRQLIEENRDATDTLSKSMATVGARYSLETQILVLEGRLNEASYEGDPTGDAESQSHIVDAIVVETEQRVKSRQAALLGEVSKRITVYAQRFGMEALSSASLKANLNLILEKGGQKTSYSKVTPGEMLRLKVATVLAMISVAEEMGVGRHPGLLMIDSPGAQEVSPKDLAALVTGLDGVAHEFKHLQLFVAALASEAITSHVATERTLHAHDDAFLW